MMKFEDPLETSLVCTHLMASQHEEQAAGPLAGSLNLQSNSDHAVPMKVLAKPFVYEMSNIFSSLSCAWKRTILFVQCRDPHTATVPQTAARRTPTRDPHPRGHGPNGRPFNNGFRTLILVFCPFSEITVLGRPEISRNLGGGGISFRSVSMTTHSKKDIQKRF